MKTFKIHCSQISKIMGRMGLTESQEIKLNELITREKPLTENMKLEREMLENKRANPELPQTAITHLKEWYAGDEPDVFSKYLDKGNQVEIECIDFACKVLNLTDELGLPLVKNQESFSDLFLIGTPDIFNKTTVIDVKSPWNIKTLHDNLDGINDAYEWQLQGYMSLLNVEEAILFYGLMDTPEDANYGREISYAFLPDNERWIAYKINRDRKRIIEVENRVLMCQKWLADYDLFVKSKIGKLTTAGA